MKVTIVSATEKEVSLIRKSLGLTGCSIDSTLKVDFQISGVGLLASCFSVAHLINTQKPDLIIQAGIAGTFNKDTILGSVVAVQDEYVGDSGAVENNIFLDLFDLNLQGENDFPFSKKKLSNKNIEKWNIAGLQTVTAITVNEITTQPERIAQLKSKYDAAIESMEGAGLHYCCLKTNTPFIQIRAISNYVGERDKSKWAFNDAFINLSNAVVLYIEKLKTLH